MMSLKWKNISGFVFYSWWSAGIKFFVLINGLMDVKISANEFGMRKFAVVKIEF